MPGNVTVTAGGGLIAVIPVTNSIIQEPIFMGEILYQYANLDLPFSPNDPGLSYTFNNTTSSPSVTLAARFFNLIDEDSTALFIDAGFASIYSGVSGGMLTGCLDVRTFGAVGDGVTDDTAAVQAALNQAHKNYQALVAIGSGPSPCSIVLSASGASLYPDSVGVPGPLGSTIVCIPSGVYCRVFPRLFDYANIGTPPANPPSSACPPDPGLVALLIDDGVTLQVDGGLILGFDENVLLLQAQTNAALGSGCSEGLTFCNTMWILENLYAFTGGPYNSGNSPATPYGYDASLVQWELGPRNQGILVTGSGFFDCGGRANITEFQTGGWLNECRGGAIKFCKCDCSQITGVTIQNFISNQGIYWGHSEKVNVFEVLFQHSYGGSVFANTGTSGVPCQLTAGPGTPGPEFGQSAFSTGPGSSITLSFTVEGTFFHPVGLVDGDVVFVLVTISYFNPTTTCQAGGTPQIGIIEDNAGSVYESLGSTTATYQEANHCNPGNPGLGPTISNTVTELFYGKLGSPVGVGDVLSVTVNLSQSGGSYDSDNPVNWGISAVYTYGLLEFDQSVHGTFALADDRSLGPITIEDNEVLFAYTNTAGPAFLTPTDPPNWNETLITYYASGIGFGQAAGLIYYGNVGLAWPGLTAPGTYDISFTSNGGIEPNDYTAAGAWFGAFKAQQPSPGGTGGFPGQQSSINSDAKFHALLFDVMRESTAYANRFVDVNSPIGEYCCYHTEIHDNIANECGMPPYGLHYATDKSAMLGWIFDSELNTDGNRYANTYANNKDMVWQPGMWVPCGNDMRTMTPTGGSIAVIPPPPPTTLTITTTSLPNGSIGNPYDAFMTATGGTLPYTWSISAGALPPGLSISTGGEISGTPTGTGTFNFTVQVVDSSMMMAHIAVRMQL
jgi:hypothetical protein